MKHSLLSDPRYQSAVFQWVFGGRRDDELAMRKFAGRIKTSKTVVVLEDHWTCGLCGGESAKFGTHRCP